MLCIGGPKHGNDVECQGPCFFAMWSRPLLHGTNLPCEPIRIVRYERRLVYSDGKQVPVWVVP